MQIKVNIKPPFGKGEDQIQTCELVLPDPRKSIFDQIKAIVTNIDDPFRIYCSLAMLCTHGKLLKLNCNQKRLIQGPKRDLVYQHASSNCNFNTTFLITSDQKKEDILSEMDKDDAELFQMAFVRHCSKLHFNGDSGLIPYRILSLNVTIQRISPTLYTYMPEGEHEDSQNINQ